MLYLIYPFRIIIVIKQLKLQSRERGSLAMKRRRGRVNYVGDVGISRQKQRAREREKERKRERVEKKERKRERE